MCVFFPFITESEMHSMERMGDLAVKDICLSVCDFPNSSRDV